MKKKLDVGAAAAFVLCLIPLVISLVYYTRLPAQLTVRFGASGGSDGFASRELVAFGVPALLFVFQLVRQISIQNDPNREHVPLKLYLFRQWTVPVVAVAIELIIIVQSLSLPQAVMRYCLGAVGLLAAVVGTLLLGKEQNRMVALRLPWLKEAPEHMDAFNHTTGYLWMAGGFITLILSFFLEAPLWLAVLLGLMLVIPAVISFLPQKQN